MLLHTIATNNNYEDYLFPTPTEKLTRFLKTFRCPSDSLYENNNKVELQAICFGWTQFLFRSD